MTAALHSFGAFVADFEDTVVRGSLALRKLTPSGDKTVESWNANQILGHLIDSATNNHSRFVRAQFTDDLEFAGYEQDNWVKAQRYEEESWLDLVQFWTSYNLHLVRIVSVISEEQLTKQRMNHSLDKIALNTVPASKPATLEYLIRDYLDHLKHHLNQIFELESNQASTS